MCFHTRFLETSILMHPHPTQTLGQALSESHHHFFYSSCFLLHSLYNNLSSLTLFFFLLTHGHSCKSLQLYPVRSGAPSFKLCTNYQPVYPQLICLSQCQTKGIRMPASPKLIWSWLDESLPFLTLNSPFTPYRLPNPEIYYSRRQEMKTLNP